MRKIAILLVIAVIMGILPVYSDNTTDIDAVVAAVAATYENTVDDWAAVTMWNLKERLGADVDFNHVNYANTTRLNMGDAPSAATYAKVAIGLTAVGNRADAEINSIASTPQIQYINELAFALLAFDSGDYVTPQDAYWTRDTLVAKTLEIQEPNGGWGYGFGLDIDATAMTIPALVPYIENADVQMAVDNAVQVMADNQLEAGGYESWGTVSSNTIAMVAMALCSIGIDPNTDARFIKNGRGLIDLLMTYVTAENMFGYEDNTTYNAISTEQGFRALVAYKMFLQGIHSFYQFERLSPVDEVIASLCGHYTKTKDDWAVITLMNLKNQLGYPVQFDVDGYLQTVTSNMGDAPSAATYAKVSLALTALGYMANEQIASAITDKSISYINELAFTLLAMDSGEYTTQSGSYWTRDTLVAKILEIQEPNGGWGYGFGLDIDATAMTIPALVPYMENADVQMAVDNAVQVMADNQLEAGGYESWGTVSSNTIAMTAMALCSIGVDPNTDARFVKNGRGLIDLLMTYVTAENMFGYEDNTAYNAISTEQGFRALVAYKMFNQDKTDFYVFDVPHKNLITSVGNGDGSDNQPSDDISITLSIQGYNTIHYSSRTITVSKNSTIAQILKDKVGASNISTRGTGATLYIASLYGEKEFDHGPSSGWMYSINGVVTIVSAGAVIPKEGDVVEWRYSVDGLFPGLITPSYGSDVESATVNVKAVNDTLNELIGSFEKKTEPSLWEAYALALMKKNVPQSAVEYAKQQIKDEQGDFGKITDLAQIVLVLRAAGIDIDNIEGYNLIELIYNNERMTVQGLNGIVFSLIVLNGEENIPENAKWTTDKLLQELLTYQNSDGGFPLEKGKDSSVDITAMTLNALAPYKGWKDIKPVIDRAIAYLESVKKNNGMFTLYGVENCESVAQVIIGRASLGLSTDEYMAALMAFKHNNVSFAHTAEGEEDPMATEQAALALIANKQGSIYNILPKPEPNADEYKDMNAASDWAREYIKKGRELGLVKGDDNNMFHPQDNITRGELAAMILRLKNEEPAAEYKGKFSDVSRDDWFWGVVEKANELGFIQGYDGKFMPNDVVTRQDMAVMISKAFDLPEANANINDISLADDYAVPFIYRVFAAEVMVGSDGDFAPKDNVKREMAVTVIVRLYYR